MKNSRNALILALTLILTVILFTLTGCGGDDICAHKWNDATCTAPKTCSLCNETEGEPLGHTPFEDDGNCTTVITCSTCGAVTTPANESHTWSDDGENKYCTVCGYTSGHVHTFENTLSYDEGGHYYASTCGHTEARKDYTPHSYLESVTEPTCTEAGYTTYVCACAKSYKDDYTPAKGHTFSDSFGTDNGGHWYYAVCGCNVTKDYSAHVYTSEVINPTCTEMGKTVNTCVCGHVAETDIVDAKGHTATVWTEASSTLYDSSSCKYTVSYSSVCADCDAPLQKTEYVEKHSLTYTVKTGYEANCVSDGIKLQLCKNEGCKYNSTAMAEITYSDTGAHSWTADSVQNNSGMTAYHCSAPGCAATKNTVSVGGSSANVSSGSIGNLDEIEFESAVIGFDGGIRDNLSTSGSDLQISAGTLGGEERENAITGANLTPEEKALLGDKDIYNFTVTASENISELGGVATIRIPYLLSDGEDADNIIVWYISNGSLTGIPATYSDGYVTFTTTHFSYYVAATISPDMLCEYLGEHDTNNLFTVIPTCTEGGYTICLRCSKQIEGSVTSPLGHNWHAEIISKNTCVDVGTTTYTCKSCDASYVRTTSATGHYYVLTEQINASCTQVGSHTYSCIYCDDRYTVTLPQLNHNYVINVVAPSCEEKGYTEKTCLTCADVIYTNYTAATEHTYSSLWYQSEAGHFNACINCGKSGEIAAHVSGGAATETSAEICTVCAYVINPILSHTHSLTQIEALSPTCLENGNIAYYVCECGAYFLDEAGATQTDHLSVILLAKGHTPLSLEYVEPTCTDVGYTAGIKCSVCDIILRGHVELSAYGHDYITKETAPTCTSDGKISSVCSACGDAKADVIIPMLSHKYVVEGIKAPTCEEGGYSSFVCLICSDKYTSDEKEALGHLYSKDLSSNEDGHWRECTRCEMTSEITAHTPSGEATEYSANICTVCLYVIEPIRNHTHLTSQSVTEKAATCTESGNLAYYICSCGEWFFDAECESIVTNRQSVIIAALGHDIVITSEVSPTCEEGGYSASYDCKRCHSHISGHNPLPATGHSYKDGICSSCGAQDPNYVPPCNHYNEEIRGVEPTCTESGLTTGKRCKLCGEITVEQIVIPAKGHSFDEGRCEVCGEFENPSCTHENTRIETIAPTCTTDGLSKTYCEKCGAKISETKIEALKHEYVNGVCVNCGEERQCDHKNTEIPGVPATCTESGLTSGKRCTICGRITVEQIVIPAKGHSFDGGRCEVCGEFENPSCTHEKTRIETIAPTCTTDGLSTTYCESCGAKISETKIEALKHEYVNGVCVNCGEAILCDHRNTEIPGVPATCTESGLTPGKRCTICGDITVEQRVIPAKGHEYVDGACVNCGEHEAPECAHVNVTYGVVISFPTCTENGIMRDVCLDCDKILSETIAVPTGHDYKDGICASCGAVSSESDKTALYSFASSEISLFLYPDNTSSFIMLGFDFDADGKLDPIEGEGVWSMDEDGVICVPTDYDEYFFTVGNWGELIPYEKPVCRHPNAKVTVIIEVTCEEDGLVEKSCPDCNKVFTETVFATGHVFENGICTACGISGMPIVYTYESKTLSFIFFSDFTTEYTEIVYTEDGMVIRNNGEGRWNKRDGMVYTWTKDTEYIFVIVNGDSLVPYEEGECKHETIEEEIVAESCESDGYYKQTCLDCGEVVEYKVYPGGHHFTFGKCTVCGVVEDGYGDIVYPDDCEHKSTAASTNHPTCTTDGYYCRYCSICGKYLEEYYIPAIGHTFVEGHCISCGMTVEGCKHENIFFEDYAPTCEDEGYRKEMCAACYEIIHIESIPPLGHCFEGGFCVNCGMPDEGGIPDTECKHLSIYSDGIGATCTEDGHLREICNDCYAIVSETFIPAMGHNFEWGYCTFCGIPEFEGGDIPTDGCNHEEVFHMILIKPTCVEEGIEQLLCAMCKMILNEFTIPPLGHCFDGGFCVECGMPDEGGIPDTECKHLSTYSDGIGATCTEDGHLREICNYCYAIVSEVYIPSTGHVFEWGKCIFCGIPEFEGGDIPTDGCNHEEVFRMILIYPTCVEDGVEQILCAMCKMIVNELPMPAFGHCFEDGWCINCGMPDEGGIPDTECKHLSIYSDGIGATCTEDGHLREICNDCNAIVSETYIPATGHCFEGGKCSFCGIPEFEGGDIPSEECSHEKLFVEDYAPTCEYEGYRKTVCAECHEIIRVEYMPALGHNIEDGCCTFCGQWITTEKTKEKKSA